MDDDAFEELTSAVYVSCPYCGEEVELLIDPAGGGTQEYIEDCEVCCQPWQIRLSIGRDGTPWAQVDTLDEG